MVFSRPGSGDSSPAFGGSFPYGFILVFAVPWIINIFFYLIALCKNRAVHPPIWYLGISMIQNLAIALFVKGVMTSTIFLMPFSAMMLLSVTIFSLILTFKIKANGKTSSLFTVRNLLLRGFCKCCCTMQYKYFPKQCVIKEEKVSKLRERIQGNPPVLVIRLVTGFFTEFALVEPLRYGSWDGNNDNIDVSFDSKITIVKIKPELEISEEVHSYFNMAKQEYYKKLRALSTAYTRRKTGQTAVWLGDPEVELDIDIYKVPRFFSVCHNSLYVKFFNTGFGKFFYIFMMIFGFSIIFDCLFIIMAKSQTIKVSRRVAHDGSLRFPAYKSNTQYSQEDYTADSISYPIIANPAFIDAYNNEMHNNAYNNQYFLSCAPSAPQMQGEYGYPQQQAYPPQGNYPNYQMPPQQQGYPPQAYPPPQQPYPPPQQAYPPPPQGYPTPQGYQPQQQIYAPQPPPAPQQQQDETK